MAFLQITFLHSKAASHVKRVRFDARGKLAAVRRSHDKGDFAHLLNGRILLDKGEENFFIHPHTFIFSNKIDSFNWSFRMGIVFWNILDREAE